MKDSCIAILFIALIYALGYGLSWIVSCGLIKLVTMCFGATFSWGVATGIWLIACIVSHIVHKK